MQGKAEKNRVLGNFAGKKSLAAADVCIFIPRGH